ncbi:MAG: beta-propeller domain-containing protein, partial [Myxococcota bacterium]
MPRFALNARTWPLALLTVGSSACWPISDPPLDPEVIPKDVEEQIDREVGATSFLSADGAAGQTSSGDRGATDDAGQGGDPSNEAAPGAPSADGDKVAGDGERSVEEGDIYRVMPGGLIANLNAYRGLQLIDVNDVENPRVIGRLQISGSPVEMYVDGDRVFVLMNNWYGYYGVREELSSLGQWNGGVVAAIDIADPTAPVLVDQQYVKGNIAKSRLTKGNFSRALYIAASAYDYYEGDGGVWNYESHTVVKSFDVADGSITPKSELDLGGYVTDIQATNRALLVARYDWSWDPVDNHQNGTFLSVIDITSPEGEMVEGDEIEVAGYVDNQFRMDLRGDVLRVASGASWGNTTTNHLETFDASDLGDLSPIDHVTYGDGEQLFGTLFLEDKAFAVTYLRVDPFHAFSITPEGVITEESEFIVSGWNDFFRATYDETRLLGIGVNDESGRSMSVSLYDITNLQNPNPLLARAEVQADYSWSEASWDHRAFSILEDVVSVSATNGATETGLVLLPFSGYLSGEQRYAAAVQIFTFSENTLTRRGLMEHGTQVRRSFAAKQDVTANLSEASLSLFGTADPDQPVAHGR